MRLPALRHADAAHTERLLQHAGVAAQPEHRAFLERAAGAGLTLRPFTSYVIRYLFRPDGARQMLCIPAQGGSGGRRQGRQGRQAA